MQEPVRELSAQPEAPGPELRELVRRAQLGSAGAFEQLVVEFGPRLHRYLAVRMRGGADVRDVMQETLAAAWIALPRLRQAERFWPWLVGIAVH